MNRKRFGRGILAAVLAAGLLCWGRGTETAMAESGSFDIAGMALWKEAQERQRKLTETIAEMEGSWRLEYGGLQLGEDFCGQAELTGLGTEDMNGTISVTAGGKETAVSFRDGNVTVRDERGEKLLTSDPAVWSEISADFMSRTTYDLSCVSRLWVSGHKEDREDGSTVLSYELNGEAAAEQVEPLVGSWLKSRGITVSGESGWLRLDRVLGELTVSASGYMAVDRIRAEVSIPLGKETGKGIFEICVVYPQAQC